MRVATLLSIACVSAVAGLAEARQSTSSKTPPLPTAPQTAVDIPFAIDGPPPPVAPETITRDESGRATIRAVPLTSPLRIDGHLDEETYVTVPPMSGLIQMEPQEGAPANERTDAWVLFDDHNLYVSIRCWESHPDRIIANEMRRDNNNLYQNDYVGVILDTFYDRRNAAYFMVTPIGGRVDAQIANERQFNSDWNVVWDVAVGRFDGGWTVELAIPFKSLRYRPGQAQIWGFNLERRSRWRNEEAFLTRIPASFGFNRAWLQVSYSATLVGLQVPPGSKNLEVKPYATSRLTSDLLAAEPVVNDVSSDVGLDVKYGLTQNLTTDFTVNTDFAQVEADEQRVNLTRFSLFFPEKREFFLENQGLFGFGGAATSGGQASVSDTPILFYSRRIGLADSGHTVPIRVGERLTGRVGRFSVGAVNIQTGEDEASVSRPTNFTVMRLKRDVLRRSSIGAMFANRSVAQVGLGDNQAYGVDGTFSFFDNLYINSYWARTRTDGLSDDDISYRGQFDYEGDRYGTQVERLAVGAHFNPEVGFVRRSDIRRNFGLFRFSPRPRSSKRVKKLYWIGSIAYIEDGAGRLVTRDVEAEFDIEFHNSDRFTLVHSDNYELLTRPFPIAPGIIIPVGGYSFNNTQAGYNFGQQRRLSGNVVVEYGTFYSGHRAALTASGVRTEVTPQFSVEPNVAFNWVDLVEGSFTTTLLGPRVTYTMTPRMFTSALVQYNSSTNTTTANVRFRWEYKPGSELFVVYNDERNTTAVGFPELTNRAFIIKVTRLFRY
jgi:uncharacterized protein DUF5916/cellulose/xylan binding protein with CBM9 domain